jgi:hypothetical protein
MARVLAPSPDETPDLLGQLFILRFKAIILRLLSMAGFASDLDLRPHFSNGTLCHVKEAHRVSIRTALISLRQITRDTHGTLPNLIAKAEVILEVLAFRYAIHSHRQIFCHLPHE